MDRPEALGPAGSGDFARHQKHPWTTCAGCAESGLEAAILKLAAAGVPVLGICGGYQMLGRSLSDPDGVEGGKPGAVCRGLGLLPAETVFCAQKTRTRVQGTALAGPFAGAALDGYEIHMGATRVDGRGLLPPVGRTGRGLCRGQCLWHLPARPVRHRGGHRPSGGRTVPPKGTGPCRDGPSQP